MPERADIRLEKTGKYTIYHEYRSVVDNRVYASSPQEISGLEIARAVVVPEFPAAIVMVAAVMAIIIGLGKSKRLRQASRI